MKKLLLLVLVLLLSIKVSSQNFTLDNIIELKMSKIEKIIKVMEAKKWEVFEFDKNKFVSYIYENRGDIEAMITFYKNSLKEGIGSTLMITYSKKKFLSYKNQIIKYKGSLEKIFYKDGNKVEEYKLNQWVIQLKIDSNNEIIKYEIFVI